jgi:c-di-GMP-related signal transduction protein
VELQPIGVKSAECMREHPLRFAAIPPNPLAEQFGLRVVAEGVEDQGTWQELDALGCDAIQGYYISRPVPPDSLITWL